MINIEVQKEEKGHINPEIYGQFAEHLGRGIYEGIYVGEDSNIPNRKGLRSDVVDALKEISVPVLRWPGGCFADTYHWKEGIGPKENRKRIVNTTWGNVVEDNSFGTHEFFELCEQLGCKTYINGNVGTGTLQEMVEWVDYMTFPGESPLTQLRSENGRKEPWRVDYFGIGNESWGYGGNMTAQYYGGMYRHYQCFLKNYNEAAPMNKVCVGPSDDDYVWTRQILEECYKHPHTKERHGYMDSLSLHYYVVPGPWEHKGSATEFTNDEYKTTIKKAGFMEEIIKGHFAIMDEFDPEKKISLCVDEWGCWFDVEKGTNPGFLYQQNTMRDAMVAAITLNIFNNHCDRVRMACIAQMVNVLQAMVLTDKEKMVLTPTYFVFKMFRDHQDATLLSSVVKDESDVFAVSASVSKKKDGKITATLVNPDPEKAKEVTLTLQAPCKEATAEILSGEVNAHNTFERPDAVSIQAFDEFEVESGKVRLTLPPCSVVTLHM